VKVAAALPYICADLRRDTLEDAWSAYRRSWRDAVIIGEASMAIATESRHSQANAWKVLVAR
jgi:nitroimidazol reductase NimA-like FMN-containing flavoprotein (pyridoxamine 5'-phosphate oxidase superfamily)